MDGRLFDQENKLIMHYGYPSNDGLSMRVSLEYMVINIGHSAQALQEARGL